jgi:glycosyltransferase involved in cell wall biosynthesis
VNTDVDVLMATYNGEKYVDDQIESIEAQSFKDFSILISDDGSSDSTLAHVEKMSEKYRNITNVSSSNHIKGVRGNFLFLSNKTNAEYAFFCDQDDYWLPQKVELSLQKMKEMEQEFGKTIPLLVFTDMKVVDSSLSVMHDSFEVSSGIDPERIAFKYILTKSIGAGCSMLVNRVLLDMLKKTPGNQPMIMHDWWASLIAAGFGAIGHVDTPTSLYRQHQGNLVGAKANSFAALPSLINSLTEKYEATYEQAVSFREVYGAQLDSERSCQLDAFIATGSGGVFSRLLSLFRSGAWKKGFKKVGQVVAVMRYKSRADNVA